MVLVERVIARKGDRGEKREREGGGHSSRPSEEEQLGSIKQLEKCKGDFSWNHDLLYRRFVDGSPLYSTRQLSFIS